MEEQKIEQKIESLQIQEQQPSQEQQKAEESVEQKKTEETQQLISVRKRAAVHYFRRHLEPNTTYYYCDCGYSKNQPFCDGAHEGTIFKPIAFSVKEYVTQHVLCGCKETDSPPYCDGKHIYLKW